MLAQRRIVSLVDLFAWQGAVLVGSTLAVAYSTGQHHLYYSAALTLALKVILLPLVLHRLIRRLAVRWDTEPLLNIPATDAGRSRAGGVLRSGWRSRSRPLASTVTRSTLGIAIAVVMLSFLMMITRRKAMSQVIGFLAHGERPVLRRHQRDLRHADGGRARRRARRAGRGGDPGRVLLPDPRAVRQPRPAPPRDGSRRTEDDGDPLPARPARWPGPCCWRCTARAAGPPSSTCW